MTWRAEARCRDVDTALFFAERGGVTIAAAKQVCSECPVRQECLDAAIQTNEPYGVWGGATVKERARYRRQRNAERLYNLRAASRLLKAS